MSSIQKRGKKWRVFVMVDGERDSRTFLTKAECVNWANTVEKDGILARHTLKEALDRYKPISESKKGWQAELSRIKSLSESDMANLRLESLSAAKIASWRDERLKTHAPVSVRREMIVLASVLRICRDEWGWMHHDPLKTIRKPSAGPARRRGIAADEIDRILANLQSTKLGPQVSLMFRLSLETGMRLSEMLGLTWDDVTEKSVKLRETKNGDIRYVPLSQVARECISERRDIDPVKVFTLSPHTVSQTFRRSSVNNVHFHDARSEAITRLSKKLDVLQLAKMIGHRDIKSLMLYYSESPESIADRLD